MSRTQIVFLTRKTDAMNLASGLIQKTLIDGISATTKRRVKMADTVRLSDLERCPKCKSISIHKLAHMGVRECRICEAVWYTLK